MRELVATGAAKGKSSKDVAARSDVIITMLPDGPDAQQVVLGVGGVLEGAREGSVLIDMSSINPLISQEVGKACASRDVDFMDAPVSGGETKAINGTLAIMVGGNQEVFDKALPIV